MLEALSFQTLADPGVAENVDRALFKHPGAHTRLYVFA
jgi:hypothetical protein